MMKTLSAPTVEQDTSASTLKVSALHAFAYCSRLFYLEEVEELYTQDAAVFAGRRLHAELERQEDEDWEDLFLENAELGLRGRVDALRTRDGQMIPYEHKRGRCHRGENKEAQAWESDRLQILAYACLLEAAFDITILEGRIRYHTDNVLVHVPLDEPGRQWVRENIAQAKHLRDSTHRPPVTTNERLCTRCSLAPVCLPEEARLAHDRTWQPVRLFPQDDERDVVHILEPGTAVGRTSHQLKIRKKGEPVKLLPLHQVSQLVLHSFSQISTQALHLCAGADVGVHFISGGGRYVGSLDQRHGSIQRRIGQYRALDNGDFCLQLARQLVQCRGSGQRKFLMRGKRNRGISQSPSKVEKLNSAIAQMKAVLKQVSRAKSLASLLGLEGNLAALYFKALPVLVAADAPVALQFSGRNRRPPKDRFNALLGFGYALLLKDVMNAILSVGLEPALGFYHQPRSQTPPLGLDLMEIFRVPLVNLSGLSSQNSPTHQQCDHTYPYFCLGSLE